ncbi:MAG: hypothetical protein ACSHX7_11085 [Luteolibacter sp.]
MKNLFVFVSCSFVICSSSLSAKEEVVYEEKDGVVVMEAENTASRLGKWKEKTEVEGFCGEGYLEFTGNSPVSGEPDSPLKYEFTVNRDGRYFLHLHAGKEEVEIKGKMRQDATGCGE